MDVMLGRRLVLVGIRPAIGSQVESVQDFKGVKRSAIGSWAPEVYKMLGGLVGEAACLPDIAVKWKLVCSNGKFEDDVNVYDECNNEGSYVSGVERGFLSQKGSRRRRGVKEKQCGLATVASPTSSQDGGLKEGKTVTSESTGQVAEVTAAPSGTPDASTTPVNPGTPHEANLLKLDANVPNDADYDVWLPLASVHELSCTEDVDSVLRDGPWMIRGVPIFLNKWSPLRESFNEELSRVPTWVKFHDFSLGRSSYARILIKIDACNGFSDNLVMVVLNLKGRGYTKEAIHVECELEPPRCSTCLIFRHSVDDCPKAPKRVVNRVDKVKGGSSRADDEGFIE
ncbi:putative ribonuclease H-like domain-containing protein, partial [Tanacetum coccineum]